MERLALCIGGAGVFGAALAANREGLAITLAILGVAMFVLGVAFPRVRWFRVGPKGVEARLDEIDRKLEQVEEVVNAIARPDTIRARTNFSERDRSDGRKGVQADQSAVAVERFRPNPSADMGEPAIQVVINAYRLRSGRCRCCLHGTQLPLNRLLSKPTVLNR